LTLRDGRDGRLLVKCWHGCDPRHVLAELQRLGLLASHSDGARLPPAVRTTEGGDAARRTALAGRIWDSATEARGSPVAQYLADRGITTIPLPPCLRWAPSLRRPDGTAGPAMVTRVDGLDGELIAVHRTWIDREQSGIWHRRDRASLGPVGGGAVRLAPASETLMVGEGIETCLAAMQATTLLGWAALSTSGLRALILPTAVRTVMILADNDVNGAGERAARAAAERWLAEGRRVRLAMPPEPGGDFNDVLVGCSYARIGRIVGVAG
jgi:hypothetical protein